MFELGEKEKELHAAVGAYTVEKGIDVVICVGTLCRYMYERAFSTGGECNIYYFEKRDEMIDGLKSILKPGDSILVKASHGMQFEKVVEFLNTL